MKEKFRKMKPVDIFNLLSLPLQAVGSCILYFIVEALCRHSVTEAFTFLTTRPLVFLYNALIIFVSFTIVYLFKRRVLVRVLLSIFWIFLGVVNGVVLLNRVTPFTGPDLKMLSDASKIIDKYLSPAMVIGVVAFIAFIAIVVIVIVRKGYKFQGKIRWIVNVPLIAASAALLFGATHLALDKRVLSNYFGNIAFAYEDYGYPYCLAVTIFNTGISEPNGYGESLVKSILSSEDSVKEAVPEVKPNIIFLQLESFMDPELVEYLNLSEDPIPNFRKLMNDYSSGFYRVPAVGAGTANTEFETMTGMSLRYFGPGEYPYKSILSESTAESAPYVLKNIGYGTHAIHNNEANFYSRKSVFKRLGYDSFTSEEYMPDISDTTETGWVKDHVLTDEITAALDSTDTPDYVYTISVQGHGDYSNEPVLDNPKITVTGAEDKEKNNYAWEYYVNQINEMDQFVKELTDTLSKRDEPTVLVMYGDHLPTMGLEAKDLKNRYLFQTNYVIWDNMGLKKQDQNINAYQMAAEVFDRLGIHEGNVFKYHQARKNTKNYQVDLEVLQYDLLYGKKYTYGGESPYKTTDMQMGVREITMDKIEKQDDKSYYVYGKNFTDSSRLEVNGELVETKMIDNTQLLVKGIELKDGDKIAVAQQSNSATKKVLTRTDSIIYEKPALNNPIPTISQTPSSSPTPSGSPTPSSTKAPSGSPMPSSSPTPTDKAQDE